MFEKIHRQYTLKESIGYILYSEKQRVLNSGRNSGSRKPKTRTMYGHNRYYRGRRSRMNNPQGNGN